MDGHFCEPLFPTQQPIKPQRHSRVHLIMQNQAARGHVFWARFGNSKRKPCSFALRHFQQIIDLAIRGASTKQRLKARFRKTCEREREREMGAWSKTQKPFLFRLEGKDATFTVEKDPADGCSAEFQTVFVRRCACHKNNAPFRGFVISDFMAGFRMPRKSQSSVATLSTLNRGTSELNSF